ncbi:MAG: PAS domain S-box protein [Gemmatales bacterium]|nr:PAS domain S-box protein [Gemmatales bacterium]MDW8388187.1 PAS domain S-box protein [Gemmatales bacterium]
MNDAENLLDAFEAISLPWAVLDLQGKVKACNRALEQFLGRTRNALLGVRLITAFTDPRDAAREAELFLEVADGLRNEYRIEKRFQRQDGQWRHARVHVALTQPNSPAKPFCLSTFVDVTEEHQGYQRATRRSRWEAAARLAAEVVHRLNPLVLAGRGHLRLLRGTVGASDFGIHALDSLSEAVEQSSQLVRELATFASCQMLHLVPVDVNALLKDVIKQLRAGNLERVHVDLQCPEHLPPIVGDLDQLRPALTALLRFAARRSSPGTRAVLQVHVLRASPATPMHPMVTSHGGIQVGQPEGSAGDRVVVHVSVPGPSFDGKTFERIFEPFAVTDDLRLEDSLELSRAYGIVRQCGGDIDIESGMDDGLAITLSFAISRETVPEIELPVSLTETRRQSATVLIVEEDDQLRAFYRRLLEEQGFRLLEARLAGEALLLCLRHPEPIQAMMLDAALPHVCSRELVKQARSIRPDLGVILLGSRDTGQGETDEGKIVSLSKPLQTEALLQALATLLQTDVSGSPAQTGHRGSER